MATGFPVTAKIPKHLARTFEQVCGYDELIVLRDIENSNRIASTTWRRSSARRASAISDGKVVSISKLARVVRHWRGTRCRKMTAQIANCIETVLRPRGVGVVVVSAHNHMTTRGIHKARREHGDVEDARHVPRDHARTRAGPALHRRWRRPLIDAAGCALRFGAERPQQRSATLGTRPQAQCRRRKYLGVPTNEPDDPAAARVVLPNPPVSDLPPIAEALDAPPTGVQVPEAR